MTRKAKRGTRATYKAEPVTLLEYIAKRDGYWALGARGAFLVRNNDELVIDWASEPKAKKGKAHGPHQGL
jgi:hypothetical protein